MAFPPHADDTPTMYGGFAIVANVFDSREIDALEQAVAAARIRRSRGGARHLLSVPAIAAAAHDARLLRLAAKALGRVPIPFGATLFDKSPEANWLVAWHQDTALPLRERRNVEGWGPWSTKAGVLYAHAPAEALASVVAVRLHLDDSTAENGPLRVLPGTHTLGILSEPELTAAAKCREPVTCTVGRGGVVVMRPLIVHASSKAVTAAARRVLHFTYASRDSFEYGLQLEVA